MKISVIAFWTETVLNDSFVTVAQLQHDPYYVNTHVESIFAPGDGQVSLSIFTEEDAKSDISSNFL